jgi:hypothetical protein
MARPPETPPNKSLDTANLSPLELDWLFAHIESRRFTDPEYEVYRFILGVARFTTIPLAGLSQDGLQNERPLCHEFILILKGYVESRGLPTKNALPDVCTLTESRRWKGMTISGIQALIRRHRAAIADAAKNDEALLGATEIAKKLAQLTFSQVRRSARANRQLACKKTKIPR